MVGSPYAVCLGMRQYPTEKVLSHRPVEIQTCLIGGTRALKQQFLHRTVSPLLETVAWRRVLNHLREWNKLKAECWCVLKHPAVVWFTLCAYCIKGTTVFAVTFNGSHYQQWSKDFLFSLRFIRILCVCSYELIYLTCRMSSGRNEPVNFVCHRKPPEGKRNPTKCGFSGDHGYDNKITSMQVHTHGPMLDLELSCVCVSHPFDSLFLDHFPWIWTNV